MEGATTHGPRGELRMHPAAHSTCSALYLREVRRLDNAWRNVAVCELPGLDELDALVALGHTGLRSGWVNAYLCI